MDINISIPKDNAYYQPMYQADQAGNKNNKIDSPDELKKSVKLGQFFLKKQKNYTKYLNYLEKQCPDLRKIISYKIYVEKVVDGDTIRTEIGKIRYIGVDTSETKHPKKGQEYFGKTASQFNTDFLQGKYIDLEWDKEKVDRYGRHLAYVYANKKMVNLALVRNGLALASTWVPNVEHRQDFLNAQREAVKGKMGIWADILTLNSLSEADENISRIITYSGEINSYKKGKYRKLSAQFLEIYNQEHKLKVIILDNTKEYQEKVKITGKLLRDKDNYLIVIEDPELVQ